MNKQLVYLIGGLVSLIAGFIDGSGSNAFLVAFLLSVMSIAEYEGKK